MSARIGSSIVAGLIAGVVFGVMMQMMIAPTPAGGRMPMLAMVGQIVGSPTIVACWLCHVFNSAVIGVIFGLLLRGRVHSYAFGFGSGAAYGVAWWIIGGLILMPILLGMSAFAPLLMPPMRMCRRQLDRPSGVRGDSGRDLRVAALWRAPHRGALVRA